MWFIFALLSAVFAALVSIWAKIGLDGVNSNLATAVRTIIILIMAWGIVLFSGTYKQLPEISERNWWFLIASGLATGASWLCYFKALQLGNASQVVPVDKFSIVLDGHPGRRVSKRDLVSKNNRRLYINHYRHLGYDMITILRTP